VFCERTSVGLDVHARSVAAAAIDGETGEISGYTPVISDARWPHVPRWGDALVTRAGRPGGRNAA
jgi:hypothetical protein